MGEPPVSRQGPDDPVIPVTVERANPSHVVSGYNPPGKGTKEGRGDTLFRDRQTTWEIWNGGVTRTASRKEPRGRLSPRGEVETRRPSRTPHGRCPFWRQRRLGVVKSQVRGTEPVPFQRDTDTGQEGTGGVDSSGTSRERVDLILHPPFSSTQ